MKRFFLIFTALAFYNLNVSAQAQLPYKNSKMAIDQRVKDLLSRMTPEEKAGQLNQLNGGIFTGPAINEAGQKEKMEMVKNGQVGSMLNVIGVADTRAIQEVAMQSRLRIPLLFGFDVIHGYKTIFPIPLAEACSWEPALMQKSASIAAKEAASAGLHWTFAPMCDVSNDPRWGRVMEGAGEDPYFGSLASAARVKGFQGNLNTPENILATLKHFVAYGAVESGKEYNTVDVSRFMLYNKYLPPFRSAVEAGAATVMNSFNFFEGVPVSGNKFLTNTVLKNQLGFKGFIVSDWASFGEMVTHGYAADGKDAALKAIQAGNMMDMESRNSYKFLPELLKEKKITMQQLDEAAGKILFAKFRLGLFDDPYKYCNAEREKNNMLTPAHREAARDAGRKSIVLLKNNGVLPLNSLVNAGLIGFFAKDKEGLFDFWKGQGSSDDAVELFKALSSLNPNMKYSAGYNEDGSTTAALTAEAVTLANSSDVVLVNIGISGKMAGEDRALANPVIPQVQVELMKSLKATGKRIVAIVSAGRPLILTDIEPYADAILYTWILGTEHGNAVADVITGKYNPSAKTVMSFPFAVGQIPVYYNHFNSGRPNPTDGAGNWYTRYRDIPNEPLYPFGFGLSYTTFEYGDLKISRNNYKPTDKINLSVTVKNSGKVAGDEIVQLYIRDYVASYVRPVKELKGFNKIYLQPGEEKEVSFTLTKKDLSFYNSDGKMIFEPGKFAVMVGPNSRDLKSKDILIQ